MGKSRNASIIFIFITILVDVIGIGIIIPVIPGLLEELMGEGLSNASRVGGWLVFTFAIMQFLFAPFLGTLSDKYGRRPVLLLSLLGLGVDFYIHAIAPTVFWLFVGRVFAGICGASFTVAAAYIADISTPEKKAQNFGIMGAAFGLGFIIGPLLGGVFAKWGIRVPFYMASLLSLLNFLYGLFVLPESLPKEKRRNINLKKANPISSLMHLKRHGSLMGLFVAMLLAHLAAHALQSTWSFYTMLKFEWDEAMVGYSLALVGILVVIVQAALVKHVVKFLGQRRTIYLGFSMWTIGMFLFAMAGNQILLLIYLLPYCFGGVARPTIQGVVSNMVPDNEQGELQGAMTSIMSVAAIIGPLLMTRVFYKFTNETAVVFFPGAPFFLGGILLLTAFLLAFFTLRKLEGLS